MNSSIAAFHSPHTSDRSSSAVKPVQCNLLKNIRRRYQASKTLDLCALKVELKWYRLALRQLSLLNN